MRVSFLHAVFVLFYCFSVQVSTAQTTGQRADQWRGDAVKNEARAFFRAQEEAQILRKGNTGAYAFHDSDGVYHELALKMGDVMVYRKTNNLTASRIIGAADARAQFAVDGSGVRIGMWDMGLVFPHPEFASRLIQGNENNRAGYSTHATHVAGTLAATGLDAEAIGMAPHASLVSYTWDFDYLEMYREAQNGLRVSNHSYGYEVGWERIETADGPAWNYDTFTGAWQFGEYIQWSYYWDNVMELNPYYLIVKAAGNEAGQGPEALSAKHYHSRDTSTPHYDTHERDCATGYGCLDPNASIKNGLVVGALQVDGETLVDFSSVGPTLDGRIKPDLVSVGEAVYSTLNGEAYGVSTGTSMATPTVSGSIGLLLDLEQQYYGNQPYFWASTLKALLIHTADDIGEIGPDYRTGWGRINIARAMNVMQENKQRNESMIMQPEIADTYAVDYYASGGPVKVTLAWTDPVGSHPNAIRDKTKPVLVEDLDVVIEQQGQIYYPYVLNHEARSQPATAGVNILDNVEQVYMPFLPAGPFTVRVSRKEGGGEPVKASLVVTGAAAVTATLIEQSLASGNSKALRVYPNPVVRGETVNIMLSQVSAEQVTLVLYDVAGREMGLVYDGRTRNMSLKYSIPSHLAAGMYFIRSREGGHMASVLVQ